MPRSSTEQAFKDSMRGPSPSPSLAENGTSSLSSESLKDLPVASPSASILLISPTNRILLLHRVRTSSAFPSAHVFPGGHLSPQDGFLPPLEDVRRHEDSEAYRLAAIRECFEESGLFLAKRQEKPDELVDLSEQERDEGRKAVHSGKIAFREWVKQQGGVPDVAGLMPFSRWLTPAGLPKRFSTQMYLYFLPIDSPISSKTDKTQMHIPTPDGGVEHTAAQFLYPQEWIDFALSGDIELFPPQFFLLALIAPFLTASPPSAVAAPVSKTLLEQRERLMHFVENDGDPPWGEKCISPYPLKKTDRYLFIGMADAGPELEGTQRRGDAERVLRVELATDKERGKQRPEPQEVLWRKDVLPNEKERL